MKILSYEELLNLLKERKALIEAKHILPNSIFEKIKIKLGFKINQKDEMPLETAMDIISDYPIGIKEYLMSSEKIREMPELKKEYQELLSIIVSKKKEALHVILNNSSR